jgi:hypothetical protein
MRGIELTTLAVKVTNYIDVNPTTMMYTMAISTQQNPSCSGIVVAAIVYIIVVGFTSM